MFFFYFFADNEITAVNTEELEGYDGSINASSVDDFYSQVKNNGLEISDEILEDVEEAFADLDDEEQDVVPEGFRIKHWVSNRSFGELVDMFKHNEIEKPEMQRKFVWTSLKSSRLIESIILGLPIPPLFLLEVDDNRYEIIDGYQRLTTLYNFIEGHPWTGLKSDKKNITSRLSRKNVFPEIAGKSFKELPEEYQRKIRRSTISLVEFKQLNPGDFSSKYLIFERINTGSEKLNGMQIRKSLAYGPFMESLYSAASRSENYLLLFTSTQIKKDLHVEAFLRVLAMSDIYYGKFKSSKQGIKNILDEYGEQKKSESISEEVIRKLFSSLDQLLEFFEAKKLFRRVNVNRDIEGILNFGILESLLGVMVFGGYKLPDNFNEKYINHMGQLFDGYLLDESHNPFSTSTGSVSSIKKRFEIFEGILEK